MCIYSICLLGVCIHVCNILLFTYVLACLLGVWASQVDTVGVTMKIPATGFALRFALFCV